VNRSRGYIDPTFLFVLILTWIVITVPLTVYIHIDVERFIEAHFHVYPFSKGDQPYYVWTSLCIFTFVVWYVIKGINLSRLNHRRTYDSVNDTVIGSVTTTLASARHLEAIITGFMIVITTALAWLLIGDLVGVVLIFVFGLLAPVTIPLMIIILMSAIIPNKRLMEL
jgi:hypothetical protein